MVGDRVLDKREYLVIIEIICVILHKNIHCDPSSEPLQRDSRVTTYDQKLPRILGDTKTHLQTFIAHNGIDSFLYSN